MTPPKLEDSSVIDLVRAAVDDARELVRLEVALARGEVAAELRAMGRAALGFALALAAAVVALTMFTVAVVIALSAPAWSVAVAGASFLVGAMIAAAAGYGALPKNPLEQTRARLETDLRQIKENLA